MGLTRPKPLTQPLPSTEYHPVVSAAGIQRQQINPNQIMDKKTKTVQFEKEKDTKNTVKFAEVQTQGEAPIIGSLYVQKWFVGDATQLKVTVEIQ